MCAEPHVEGLFCFRRTPVSWKDPDMRAAPRRLNETVDLEEIIEHQIFQRTWGRVHQLRVEIVHGSVIVHGYTSSYHAKQLALEAVLDVLGPDRSNCVKLDVHVGGEGDSNRSIPDRGAAREF
jgi:hypothetical protein